MAKKSQRIWMILAGLCIGLLATFVMPNKSGKEIHAANLTIGTLAQLEQFRNDVNGGNDYSGETIELSADIDLTGVSWAPIGTSSCPFKGIFNGNGHTISYMAVSINQNASDVSVGFFGVTGSATIQNIGIINSSVDVQCSNVVFAGSLVGKSNSTAVSNSYSTADVNVANTDSSDVYVGGLLGQNNSGTVSNSYSVGNVEVSSSGNKYVGKLIGKQASGTVTNSYYLNSSTVTTNDENTTTNNTSTLSGANSKTVAQFKSGEVACLLNGGDGTTISSGGATWYQSIDNGIGPDNYPLLKSTRGTVYYAYKCGMSTKSYTNTDSEAISTDPWVSNETSHDFTDGTGFCANCGMYQKCTTEILSSPGSASNPYLITNLGQLYWYAAFVNCELDKCQDPPSYNRNACGKLLNDIVINDDISSENARLWKPMGHCNSSNASMYRYGGTFYGNNHTISGIKVNMTEPWPTESSLYAGFIGYSYCRVYDLTIKNSSVTVNASCNRCYIGGFCGNSEGGECYNCSIDCDVYASSSANNGYITAGVLFGITKCDVRDCIVKGKTEINDTGGNENALGGAIGTQKGGTINSGSFRGNVELTTTDSKESSIGNFVGRQNTGTIDNSYSTGNVTLMNQSAARISRVYAGGFTGRLVGVSTITNSYSTGDVLVVASNSRNTGEIQVGGFASCCKGTTFSKCYSTGNVTVTGQGNVRSGGFIGQVETKCNISDCYARGNINGTTPNNSGNHKAGGFVGNLWANQSGKKSINRCYSSGSLTIDTRVRLEAGKFNGSGSIDVSNDDLYCSDFLINKTGVGNFIENTTGIPKSTEEFASGEVTYLLNGSTSEAEPGEELVWYQSVDNNLNPHDSYPVFDSNRGIVYGGYVDCINMGYSNREVPLNPGEHSFTEDSNGFCMGCRKYQPCGCDTESQDDPGSDSNPYLIENAGQLYWFAAVVNNELDKCVNPPQQKNVNACAQLNKNIVINTNEEINSNNSRLWVPIGQGDVTTANMYGGIFNGNNKTISGMKIDVREDIVGEYITLGLFGSTYGAAIKNVSVINSNVCAENLNGLYAGSLVGYACNSEISNSYTAVDIACNGQELIIGGFVGAQWDGGIITNCYSIGNVTAAISGDIVAGGFVGEQLIMSNNRSCDISNSYAIGNISIDGSGQKNVGRLIGKQMGSPTPTVTNSYYLISSEFPEDSDISVLIVGTSKTVDEFNNFAVKDLLQDYVNNYSSVDQPLLSWVQGKNYPLFNTGQAFTASISWGDMIFNYNLNAIGENNWSADTDENLVIFNNCSTAVKLRYTADYSNISGVTGITGTISHEEGDYTYQGENWAMVNSSDMVDNANSRVSALTLSGAPSGVNFSGHTDKDSAIPIGKITMTISN